MREKRTIFRKRNAHKQRNREIMLRSPQQQIKEQLTIIEGGMFDGKSSMGKDESKIVEFQTKGG